VIWIGLIWSAVGLLLTAAGGDPVPGVAAGWWMLVQLARWSRDMSALGERITRLSASRRGPTLPEPWTGQARFLCGELDRLACRQDLLEGGGAAEEGVAVESEPHRVEGVETGEEHRLVGELVGRARRSARATAVAAVLPGPQGWWVVSDGISGHRFERTLLASVEAWCAGGSLDETMHDGDAGDGVFGDFSRFGHRYTVCRSFGWHHEGDRQGLLWFGFGVRAQPGVRVVARTAAAARRFGEDLSTGYRLGELSGRVAEVEALSREKSEFIAQMSHDIRSPLNNIRSVLTVLKLESLPPGHAEMIDVAVANCDGLAEIVEDILDFSRHQAGRLTARREVVDLGQCVEQVVESFRIMARLRGLELVLERSLEEVLILADRRHIRRVLTNLISNALKYTPAGRVRVAVTRSQDDRWCLTVEDTGVGMSEGEIRALFTPFTPFQRAGGEGVGLGLAVSRILLGLIGGEVRVASAVGRGSTFSVLLPAAASVRQFPGLPLEICTRRPRVLVVDDDVDCTATLARLLERQGYAVLRAATVRDAISVVNFGEPEIVITDAGMPDGGGRSVLRFLVTRRRRLPAIVLSGRSDERLVGELRALGAAAVLLKPVDARELEEVIQGILRGAGEAEVQAVRAACP